MAVQQLCGFNSLMYYSATLFAAGELSDPGHLLCGVLPQYWSRCLLICLQSASRILSPLVLLSLGQIYSLLLLHYFSSTLVAVECSYGHYVGIALAMAAVAFSHIPLNSALELEGEAPLSD